TKTGAEFRSFSDEKGTWTIATIPADTYTITATSPASAPGTLRDVKVEGGATATANITLQVGISETVVVTASRTEQLHVDAPSVVTLATEQRRGAMPTQNCADVMRQVPGVTVGQMSARAFNVPPRGPPTAPASSQLVMIDGRPINQDYYGYVA